MLRVTTREEERIPLLGGVLKRNALLIDWRGGYRGMLRNSSKPDNWSLCQLVYTRLRKRSLLGKHVNTVPVLWVVGFHIEPHWAA
jgi:hypothetical protein